MKKSITIERAIFPGSAALGRELTDAASHLAPSHQAPRSLLSTQHEAHSTLQEAALTEQGLRDARLVLGPAVCMPFSVPNTPPFSIVAYWH